MTDQDLNLVPLDERLAPQRPAFETEENENMNILFIRNILYKYIDGTETGVKLNLQIIIIFN